MKRYEAIATMAKKLKCSVPTANYIARLTVKFDKKLNNAEDENKSLKEQVDFLTTLLRDNQFHSSECAMSKVARHNARGMSYMLPQPCDCWLSEGTDD